MTLSSRQGGRTAENRQTVTLNFGDGTVYAQATVPLPEARRFWSTLGRLIEQLEMEERVDG